MRLHTISFGCQMAVADSEEMTGAMNARGYASTPELEQADAVLVNTCTVREHAEHRAISQIGRLAAWKQKRPERLVIVAGCAAERLKHTLQTRFPHVDLVVGAKSIDDFPALVDQAMQLRYDNLSPLPVGEVQGEGDTIAVDTPVGVTASVTIMRGCNYSCTYCIVPAVRGREVYIDPEKILSEVRRKVAGGAKEVLLLGQTVNSYRYGGVALTPPSPDGRGNNGWDFSDLLRAVDAVPGLERVRFISPHPYYLNARMIAAMAECPKVCEHLHMPVQSGSDRVLKAMRRNYTRAQYVERVDALRRAVPGVAVTTDLIVGFPGETEAEFQETLDLVDAQGFDAAFCFKYSPREGTDAMSLGDPVPEAVKEERLQRALAAVVRNAERRLAALAGSTVEVLVEAPGLARTRANRLVRVAEGLSVGTFAEVVL